MEQCPCEVCIALAMCRSRCQEDPIKFLLNVGLDCPVFSKYVIKEASGYNVILDDDHADEAGRHLGYTISKTGSNKSIIKSDTPPTNPNGTFRRKQ